MIKSVAIKALLLSTLLLSLSSIARPTLDDFTREADYRMASLSPSGRYLAEVWNEDKTQIRLVTVRDLTKPNNPIIGKTADNVIRPSSVSWANDERLLIKLMVPYQTKNVIRASKKDDDFDIYDHFMFARTIAVDPDLTNETVLLEDQRRVRTNVNLSRIRHYLPEDPDHILMSANKGGRLVQYKVNVNTGKSDQIIKGGRFTFSFINDIQGKPLYRLDYLYIAKHLRIYELKKDDWELIETIDLDIREETHGLDRGDLIGLYNGDLIYRKQNEKTGFNELWVFNAKEKSYQKLVSVPDRDILYPLTSLRSNEVVGYATDGDLIKYHFFDDRQQEEYDHIAGLVDGYNFSFRSYSKDGRLAIIRVYGRDNPSSYNLYDFEKRKLTVINRSYFSLPAEELSIPVKANFKARDDLPIELFLLLPKGYQSGKKYPLVVLPHGGPQARDRADYDNFAQFVSTRGYIVAQPNFRGSTGFGKTFERAGYKQWGEAMQDDLEDAVHFLIEQGLTEVNKACIAGISYGGYAALMGAVKSSKLFRCAISINGVTDLPNMIEYDEKVLDDDNLIDKYLHQRIGHPKKDEPFLVARSPVRLASKFKVPVLVVASTDDEIVPYSQAKALVKALKKADKPYQFLKLKDTGHNPFYYRDDMIEVYGAVEEFLAKHLN